VREWATTPERQRKVFEALAFKLEMLWAMIDTIHNAYAEPELP
jgi:pyrroloquinoline quinone (PQQ) biosynthesis protein C